MALVTCATVPNEGRPYYTKKAAVRGAQAMSTHEFLPKAHGRVSIGLTDGTTHTGRFREDILSPSAMSVYFYGERHDMSLPIDAIACVVALEDGLQLAS
jgi:hypothetical protein